ncbi:MAG: hypothetical protein FWH08_06495 [Oscillospiraceae bacterium]|nr:hypothetical protein [Oscillospiraceae bacterium]
MKKKLSFLIIFFIIACAGATVVRYVQLISETIDFSTGFFDHHAGILKYLHYIVLGVSLLGFIILTLIEKRRKTRFFTKRMGHFDDADAALCGIMFLLAGFAVIYTAVYNGFLGFSLHEKVTVALGMFSYGYAGVALLFRRRALPSIGIALLGLSGYYIIRLMDIFLDNYIILSMPEHIVRLILIVFLALFYLSAGRMFLRAESKSTRAKACIFGFFAATIAASEITAKMIFWLGSPTVMRDNLLRSDTTRFIMPDMLAASEAIALLVFLACMTRYKSERVKIDGEADAE